MLKKTITYTDYDGNERTEDFYFNLTQAEAMEMEFSTSGGMVQMINHIVATQDAPSIIKTFKKIILAAYGKKSPDGRRFMKSPEISKDFEETEAYSQLFMELSTDTNAASAFVNGILPHGKADVDTKKTENPASEATAAVETANPALAAIPSPTA